MVMADPADLGHGKKKESSSEAAQNNDYYVIEKILEIKETNNVKEFLVSWVGYPETEATWEPEDNIPGFIRKYYEDKSKIGSKLSAPCIRPTNTVDGVKHNYLKWDTNEGDWISEEFFKLLNEDGEIVDVHEPMCNTRKSRDKIVKRHTLGIVIGASPCGIVRFCEELFGSESLSQVYGILIKYLSSLSKLGLEVIWSNLPSTTFSSKGTSLLNSSTV